MNSFGGKRHPEPWNVTERRKPATSRNHYNRRKPKKCERSRNTSLSRPSKHLGGEKVATTLRRRVKEGKSTEQGARLIYEIFFPPFARSFGFLLHTFFHFQRRLQDFLFFFPYAARSARIGVRIFEILKKKKACCENYKIIRLINTL